MAGTILNAGKQHFATARYGRVADRTSNLGRQTRRRMKSCEFFT
jgi:hypothetical protein